MNGDQFNTMLFPTPRALPNYRLSLLCLLLIKAALMTYVMMRAGIELGPDEAQYWTWSHALDWGYYSKPPAIAWQIAWGTYLFGDTEFGIRFGSVVIGFLLPAAVYLLANRAGAKDVTAFWSGTLMALTPAGILSALFATTDGGYVLFATLALASTAHALRLEKTPNYLLIGLYIFLGALFKWNAYCLWAILGCAAFYLPQIRSRYFFLGLAISALALLPSLVWNSSHDWATFRHVWSTNIVGQSSSSLFQGNFLSFLGAQIALLSPVFSALLVLAWWTLLKREGIPLPLAFCGYTALGIFTLYCSIALGKKMQGNWAVFAYPPAIVFLCWYASEWLLSGKPWLLLGSLISLLLTIFVFTLPQSQAEDRSIFPLPFSANPFKHNVGWRRLEPILREAGYNPRADFLFASRYQTSSVLSFYAEEQKRAYFFNLDYARKNQFSYWPSMAKEQIGKNGYFIEVEVGREGRGELKAKVREINAKLRPYFTKVEFVARYALYYAYGKPAKWALIFRCVDYNGKEPVESDHY